MPASAERPRATSVVREKERLLPGVSCILVSHRKPLRVHDAVRSVFAQAASKWQLIINDSGSLVGELRQYESDPRVTVVHSTDGRRCQGWQINHVRPLAEQGLICYLSDDDTYDPVAFAVMQQIAHRHPAQSAWYGPAEVWVDGQFYDLVFPGLTGGPGVSLDRKIDGLQVWHRANVVCPWPEDESYQVREHADGIFIDALGRVTPVHPTPLTVGRHRVVPESAFHPPGL